MSKIEQQIKGRVFFDEILDLDGFYYMLRKWDFPPEVLKKIDSLLCDNLPDWVMEKEEAK